MTTSLTPEMTSAVHSAGALGPRLQLEVAVALGAAAASVDALDDPEISLGLLCPTHYESDFAELYVAGADEKAQTTALISDNWRTQGHVVATALSSLFGPSVIGAPHAPHGADLDATANRLMELRREYTVPMRYLLNAGLAAGYLSTALELPAPRITETYFTANVAWDFNRRTFLDVGCTGDVEQSYDFIASNSQLRYFIADDASTPAEICARVRTVIAPTTTQVNADSVQPSR